jgi:hypothetical protein
MCRSRTSPGFIKPWFYETGYPDLALKAVTKQNLKTSSGNTKQSWKITIEKKGSVPVPIYMELVLQNDSVIKIQETPAAWKGEKKEFAVQKSIDGELKEVRLGNSFIPDKYREDNIWKAKLESTKNATTK